ncbi:MAG: magnesium transporter [Campylobacterales bacterium]|nr:magnesium transporter [Campylobacterales bacterium]
MNLKAVDLYIKKINNGLNPQERVEDADVADYLENVKRQDEKRFVEYLNSLPTDLKAKTFLELPYVYQVELIEQDSPEELANLIEALESDDATDLIQAVAAASKAKEDAVFNLLSDKKQQAIEQLIHYSEDEAGSLMQTELFKVESQESIQESLTKLKTLKERGIGNVQYLFVVDGNNKLLKTIGMDDLILEKMDATFEEIIEKYPAPHAVTSHDSIDHVLKHIEKYDISSLPVVDRMGHLIGRITHDDIIDTMQESATKQIYALSQINQDEELQDTYIKTAKSRASWLFINLINAILASLVIGVFEATLDKVVALAILLPIVANMAGTASVQTMTVIIRQMAIGELAYSNLKAILKKEMSVALSNGLLFGAASTVVAQVWFGSILISLSMGLAMFVSILSAGVLGTLTPVLIKKANYDPAIASSVIVITLVDIIGFFSFLWFSTLIIL